MPEPTPNVCALQSRESQFSQRTVTAGRPFKVAPRLCSSRLRNEIVLPRTIHIRKATQPCFLIQSLVKLAGFGLLPPFGGNPCPIWTIRLAI